MQSGGATAPPLRSATLNGRQTLMLMVLVIALLILWALGAFAFKIAGGLIHLLLVIAVVVLIYRFVSGRRPV
jgi:Family of unknown function (DUF5670)